MRCRLASPILALAVLTVAPLAAQSRERARDLGIPFDGTPGRYNAITDVAGVEVGHRTLISSSGRLRRGVGPVRTGVTAVLPRGRASFDPVFAAWFALNGNGEMTGTIWIDEGGFLEGPVLITNTHSVGAVRDATIAWMKRRGAAFLWALPVVAETYDGILNDIDGFHVKAEHAHAALDSARGGPVREGAVGGGTGMLCNGFKGGIGTSSRVLPAEQGAYTLGVLVQCNYGSRQSLRIAGVPVGKEFPDAMICAAGAEPSQAFLKGMPKCAERRTSIDVPARELGSIIIVVATDAPLLPHQLERVVKRTALGLGREGSIAGNGSGDIFVAFSTANRRAAADSTPTVALRMVPNERLDPIFAATVQATEEAITNAMLAAETMTGADDVRAYALPHDRLREIMRKYGR
jgi:D-aminopeptidase